MSGGSHNYICYQIEEDLCGQMEDAELNDLVHDIADLAHDLEWYHSGDTNEEDYRKSVKNFKEKWFKSSRADRLKWYIDRDIESLKSNLYSMIGASEEPPDDTANNAYISAYDLLFMLLDRVSSCGNCVMQCVLSEESVNERCQMFGKLCKECVTNYLKDEYSLPCDYQPKNC